MKFTKISLAVVFALVFVSSSLLAESTIKPKGSLQYRVMKNTVTDTDTTKDESVGPTTDGGLKIGADVTSGNLTAAFQIAAKNGDAAAGIEESWIQYAFTGLGSLKVNMKEADTGYNCDIYNQRVSSSMSLKFAADAGFFATIQSSRSEVLTKDESVATKNSAIPVIEAGYTLKPMDAFSVSAGIAIDKTDKGDTGGATSTTAKALTGFLPWANLSYNAGMIVFDLAGQYSQNCARISPIAGEGSTYGVQAKVTVKPNDNVEAYAVVRYMSKKPKGGDATTKLYLESIVTYKYDANLSFSAGLNEYSSEKADTTGANAAKALKIRLFQIGYSI